MVRLRVNRRGPHHQPGWRRGCGSCSAPRLRPRSGAMSGGQAVQMVKAARGDLPLWVAGGGRRQPGRSGVHRPEPTQGPTRPGAEDRQRPAAPIRSWAEGDHTIDWMVPIVADGEAGFGGAQRLRADQVVHRGGGRRRAPSRTSSPPRRSAGTWAARSSSPPRSTSGR